MKMFSAGLVLAFLALLANPALAVDRFLAISAPDAVRSGEGIHLEITASTTARDGEQIGFFQTEYSVDGGKNWVPVYAEKLGKSATKAVDFSAGPAGVPALVRVRIAFRGGMAGDVDFAGKPIAWGGGWTNWETPPAKRVTIQVGPR